VTPDGAHVFTHAGNESLFRFSLKDGQLVYRGREGTNPFRQGIGSKAGITVSPDSKLVCLPRRYAKTVIYRVDTFPRQDCALEVGANPSTGDYYPEAVGFDLAAGSIYTHTGGHELIVCTPGGAAKRVYTFRFFSRRLPRNAEEAQRGEGELVNAPEGVRQLLVHPGGNRVVLLTAQAVYAVEVPGAD
jgi:hypothetical protein